MSDATPDAAPAADTPEAPCCRGEAAHCVRLTALRSAARVLRMADLSGVRKGWRRIAEHIIETYHPK